MIAIHINEVKSLLVEFNPEIEKILSRTKKALKEFLNNSAWSHNRQQKAYLEIIISNLKDIVFATPLEIEVYKNNELGRIPEYWKKKNGNLLSFKDGLLNALDYNSLRQSFYPKYFQKLGIKACVFCNSQLTICSEEGENVTAKFQIDHFLDKANYPCFSISFFNLYPTCASCNNIKRNKTIDFQLYSDSRELTSKSNFQFSFIPGCVAKYLDSKNNDDIEIEFTEPNNDFQNTFDIKGIYDTQKDIAEELILKSKIYTKSYREALIKSYPSVFNHSNINNRIFMGNYSGPNEIHKRPMSKFMQDLAKQQKLI